MGDRTYEEFLALNPSWTETTALDELRASEYARLDEQDHVYLDYTGGGLYGESQVRNHCEFMAKGVYGNPHSGNPASMLMTEHVERTRAAVLDYFNASPDEYTVIFTPNASGALRLVGEAYPFRGSGHFALTADNHNSVNGIREFAAHKHTPITYLPIEPDELRLDMGAFDACINDQSAEGDKLLAFPAQSNYSGVKHPLSLVDRAQAQGWDVLVDCAAFAPSSRVDFAEFSPDYACFSFYKIFGYPTGIGCLIAKHDKLHKLVRPWFAGGTIQVASVMARSHFMANGEAAFEDGTINYLNLPAIASGLELISSVGIDTISKRVMCLTSWILKQLTEAVHSNGQPMVHIHGPTTTVDRGGTVTCTIVDPSGEPYSGARIEELAAEANISIRTGCFCNPGAGEAAFKLQREVLDQWFQRPANIGFQELVSEVRAKTGIELSALRISVGLVSNYADMERLMDFVDGLRDRTVESLGSADAEAHIRDTA
ncbi:MAG: aminotransferase class V-fold PLP-dependent enzyme [Acidimicrobiales bacterium]